MRLLIYIKISLIFYNKFLMDILIHILILAGMPLRTRLIKKMRLMQTFISENSY